MSVPLPYRSQPHTEVPTWRRWWPLAAQEFTSLFRSRWGVVLFALCLLPGLGRLVMLLILFGVVQFGPNLRNRIAGRGGAELAAIDPMQANFYIDPVLQTMPGLVFTLLLSTLVVARAIARDRTTNALELYWTRGISPQAYLFAKWLGSFLLVGLTTVVVPLVLWLTAISLHEDWALLQDTAVPMLRALCGVAVATAVWTAVGVAISAAAPSPNAAMVAWAMLLVGSQALGQVLGVVLREPWLRSCVSLWDAGGVVARAIGDLPQRQAYVPGAAALLVTLLGTLGWCALRRMRLEEAIA